MPHDSPFTEPPSRVPGRQQQHRNRILRALTPEDYAWLAPALEPVDLPVRTILTPARARSEHLYFPETGVGSMVNRVAGGSGVEVGTIGPEGAAGLQSILSGEALPSETFIQVGGHGFRVPAAKIAKGAATRPAMRRVFDRYAQAFLVQVSQTATCNLLHPIDERCARWLLMTHDSVGADSFELTHEFLAFMLGVRRAGVTVAAGMLQRAGTIRYTRGKVSVLDREALESAACDCFGVVRDSFARLVGGATPVEQAPVA